VQIVPPNEVVVVVGLELKMSNRAGTMNLCIPYNAIEPVVDALSTQSWFAVGKTAEDEAHHAKLTETLGRATLRVSGVLAETTITVNDLAELSPGDLILTEKPSADPVTLCVEGERKFFAHLGQHRGQLALRVDRAIVLRFRGPACAPGAWHGFRHTVSTNTDSANRFRQSDNSARRACPPDRAGLGTGRARRGTEEGISHEHVKR
jgi:flagellar motor switch/type III secretory pathway protein FliN